MENNYKDSLYDVSVVIPTRNRAELLDLTLNSLFNQNNNIFSCEVIVINDGSTDNTKEIVAKYGKHENLKPVDIVHQDGFNIAKVRNEGLRIARGEVVVFIDSGIIVNPYFIFEHAKWHFTLERNIVIIGFVYGVLNSQEDVELYDIVNRTDIPGVFEEIKTINKYIDVREAEFGKFNYSLEKMRAPWVYFWTCNVSVRRSNLFETGLFDGNFTSWGGEDIDLGYRLYKNNSVFLYSRETEAIHYPHTRNHTINLESNQDNTLYIYDKYQDVMIEFLYCNLGGGFNLHLQDFFIAGRKRIDYGKYTDCKVFDNFLQKIKNRKNMLVGAFNNFFIDSSAFEYCLEFDKEKAEKLVENSKIIIQNKLGVIIKRHGIMFDNAVITEFINFITEKNWLLVLLKSITSNSVKTFLFTEFCYNKTTIYRYDTDLLRDIIVKELGKSCITETICYEDSFLKVLCID